MSIISQDKLKEIEGKRGDIFKEIEDEYYNYILKRFDDWMTIFVLRNNENIPKGIYVSLDLKISKDMGYENNKEILNKAASRAIDKLLKEDGYLITEHSLIMTLNSQKLEITLGEPEESCLIL